MKDQLTIDGVIPAVPNVLVTVIVTHYNYSHLVGQALRSVAAQTHRNFECIIVDDGSKAEHVERLRAEVAKLGDKRFRVLALARNMGQTAAVFEGLKKTSGDFVTLLDPDDLYDPEFLATMLRCHLNPVTYAAVAACEMALYRVGGGQLSATYSYFKVHALADGSLPRSEASFLDFGYSKHYPAETPGWLWCTTSSLMFRRDALRCLERKTFIPELRICADAFCVYGAHLLGGTLYVDKALSWRGIHGDNAVESETLISIEQRRHKPEFKDPSQKIKLFAARTIIENGTLRKVKDPKLSQVFNSHFSKSEILELFSGHEKHLSIFVFGNGT